MKIDNQTANELLIAVRKGDKTQEFMDAVSGVEGYSLTGSRQGCIRGKFVKELLEEQFLFSSDDLIPVFWSAVFEKLDRAKLWGEVVEIKSSNKVVERRETQNNPIHYLRYHGTIAVRNYINAIYRRNLQQECIDCRRTTSIRTNKTCKCGGLMKVTYKFAEDTDLPNENEYYNHHEEKDTSLFITRLLKEFADTELVSKVSNDKTRAQQILEILTVPSASREMCAACKLCDADTFDIDACTNYNVNIGTFLGINKTLVASKVRRIRKALPKWLKDKGTPEALDLLAVIPAKFKTPT